MPLVERDRLWSTGIGSGVVAHFLGVGAGLVYMPTLNTILGKPIHQGVTLSQATMVIGSSVGTLIFILLGLFRGLTGLPA